MIREVDAQGNALPLTLEEVCEAMGLPPLLWLRVAADGNPPRYLPCEPASATTFRVPRPFRTWDWLRARLVEVALTGPSSSPLGK